MRKRKRNFERKRNRYKLSREEEMDVKEELKIVGLLLKGFVRRYISYLYYNYYN